MAISLVTNIGAQSRQLEQAIQSALNFRHKLPRCYRIRIGIEARSCIAMTLNQLAQAFSQHKGGGTQFDYLDLTPRDQ